MIDLNRKRMTFKFAHGRMRIRILGSSKSDLEDRESIGDFPGPVIFLSDIKVDADRRSKGIGSQMLEALCRDADIKGVGIVLVSFPYEHNGKDTQVARLKLYRKFYQRHGFIWGEWGKCYRTPVQYCNNQPETT